MPSAACALAPQTTKPFSKRESPFVPIQMRGRMADALVGAEAAKSAVRRAGDDALRARRKHRLTVQGGRLWMLLVKSRHRRADAAVKRYLAAEEEPGDVKKARLHPIKLVN